MMLESETSDLDKVEPSRRLNLPFYHLGNILCVGSNSCFDDLHGLGINA